MAIVAMRVGCLRTKRVGRMADELSKPFVTHAHTKNYSYLTCVFSSDNTRHYVTGVTMSHTPDYARVVAELAEDISFACQIICPMLKYSLLLGYVASEQRL